MIAWDSNFAAACLGHFYEDPCWVWPYDSSVSYILYLMAMHKDKEKHLGPDSVLFLPPLVVYVGLYYHSLTSWATHTSLKLIRRNVTYRLFSLLLQMEVLFVLAILLEDPYESPSCLLRGLILRLLLYESLPCIQSVVVQHDPSQGCDFTGFALGRESSVLGLASPYFLLTSDSLSQDGHMVGPALSQFLHFYNAIITSDLGSVIAHNIHGWPLPTLCNPESFASMSVGVLSPYLSSLCTCSVMMFATHNDLLLSSHTLWLCMVCKPDKFPSFIELVSILKGSDRLQLHTVQILGFSISPRNICFSYAKSVANYYLLCGVVAKFKWFFCFKLSFANYWSVKYLYVNVLLIFTGGEFYTLIAGNAENCSSLAGFPNICLVISVPVQTYFRLAGPYWGFCMPNAVVSALLIPSSNLPVISNAQLGLSLPVIHSAFSANGQYLPRKQATSISPIACFVIALSSFSFICLLGSLGSSLTLRPRYHKFVAPKKFVRMSNILQCPIILLVCSSSQYEQYLGWHFILRYSTFASKMYVNNNSHVSKDGAAAFSYGTGMRNFRVGEKNIFLFSLGASPVTIYWFSALVGSFVQLSTAFLQAQHAQILPEVRYRPFQSLCCYVRCIVWCSMIIECHSSEALLYTKGHHSLVHSLPCCDIIQDDIVSAESNCKQDAPDSLFSSTIQKHLVCSEGFDPGIWLLLESPYIFPIICLSSISMRNLIILHNGSDITWAYMKKVGDAQMVEFLQEALVSQLIHYTVQNMAYWPVWIHQHHGWMIRFPSAIVPACFNNLSWFFSIHALVLVCGLYIYWGQLTRGFIEDCCPWAGPLLMCSSFTRMLHMATNNDSTYGVLSFCVLVSKQIKVAIGYTQQFCSWLVVLCTWAASCLALYGVFGGPH